MKILNLLKGFLRGKFRGVYKLLLSNSSVARKYLRNSKAVGANSSYCYKVWLKQLNYWSTVNEKVPKIVVEIGPGNSLGVGLAALISGSDKLYALERTQFWNIETNIRVFDELVEIFREEYKSKPLKLYSDEKNSDINFPSDILNKEHLKFCLKKKRLKKIRKELYKPFSSDNKYVCSVIPWENKDIIEDDTVDFIFSHTVLQHVDNLPYTYAIMNKWLKKDGCISHKIDFKSMNSTKRWNGHWTLNELEWKLVTGGTNLINREPLSSHLKFIRDNNFKIIHEIRDSSKNELSVNDLSDEFKHLDEMDLTTSGYYYFARLNEN